MSYGRGKYSSHLLSFQRLTKHLTSLKQQYYLHLDLIQRRSYGPASDRAVSDASSSFSGVYTRMLSQVVPEWPFQSYIHTIYRSTYLPSSAPLIQASAFMLHFKLGSSNCLTAVMWIWTLVSWDHSHVHFCGKSSSKCTNMRWNGHSSVPIKDYNFSPEAACDWTRRKHLL